MKLAYCAECKTVVATGPIPDKTKPSHVVVAGKGAKAIPVRHEARLIEVPEAEPLPGEKPGAYLDRLYGMYSERF